MLPSECYKPHDKLCSGYKKTSPRQGSCTLRPEIFRNFFIFLLGLAHPEFVPTGQTVNNEYYLSLLRSLRENIRRKRPELWANKLYASVYIL